MKTVSLKLPESLEARLTAFARKRGMSKSEVVRAALGSFLKSDGKVQRGSLLDVAGDIVGCVAGPGDLSFNKKYMEDFGK